SEEHTSELQSLTNLVCRLLLEKKNDDGRRGRLCPSHLLSGLAALLPARSNRSSLRLATDLHPLDPYLPALPPPPTHHHTTAPRDAAPRTGRARARPPSAARRVRDACLVLIPAVVDPPASGVGVTAPVASGGSLAVALPRFFLLTKRPPAQCHFFPPPDAFRI